MKYEDPQKITALGVVVFSFISLAMGLVLILLVNLLADLLVLKTNLPESFLTVGNVVGCGVGLITATAFLAARGRVKGIVASGILAGCFILLKVLGNMVMHLGGYGNLRGLAGIMFVIVFCLVGGVVGSMLKKG